jgi:hypothetical protein
MAKLKKINKKERRILLYSVISVVLISSFSIAGGAFATKSSLRYKCLPRDFAPHGELNQSNNPSSYTHCIDLYDYEEPYGGVRAYEYKTIEKNSDIFTDAKEFNSNDMPDGISTWPGESEMTALYDKSGRFIK